ncbi:MAG TPA: hypothetical protein VGF95_06245 [Solirubrobacteraceae bacterium]|jgi:hypothetical protein
MSKDVTPHNAKSSDQMPEEAPAEQVPDDVPGADEGAARETARRHAKSVSERKGRQSDHSGKRSPSEGIGRGEKR